VGVQISRSACVVPSANPSIRGHPSPGPARYRPDPIADGRTEAVVVRPAVLVVTNQHRAAADHPLDRATGGSIIGPVSEPSGYTGYPAGRPITGVSLPRPPMLPTGSPEPCATLEGGADAILYGTGCAKCIHLGLFESWHWRPIGPPGGGTVSETFAVVRPRIASLFNSMNLDVEMAEQIVNMSTHQSDASLSGPALRSWRLGGGDE
jgi:hypothetical protein